MGRERTKMGFKRVTRNLLKLHSTTACGFASAVLSPIEKVGDWLLKEHRRIKLTLALHQ